MAVEKRHTAVHVLVKINNFFGWLFTVLIVTAPIGLAMLLYGHLILMQRETEENTREIVTILREGTGTIKSIGIERS